MTEQTRQYQAMAKTASWTMVSRVLGLVRDQLTAAVFGASAIGSAFVIAFQIPNLFRRLLGEGALTAAIVPVLADKSVKDGKLASFGFLNFVLRKVLPWMVGLTLIGIGVALAYAFASAGKIEAAVLTAICMPYMPLICVAALFTSAVNLSGRFGLAEIASGVLNLCMIVALGVFGENFASSDMDKAVWLCLGALIGGCFQLLIPLWGLRREGWRPGLLHVDEAAWKTLSIAFLPAALGAGVQQINVLISRGLAFNVSDAGLMYYYIANRIVELPIGLFSASIAVVIFPALATAFASRDVPALARNYGRGMRLVLAINVGAAFGLIALAVPIVQLLFNYGNFGSGDCVHTSRLLVIFALAMPFYAMISIVTRAPERRRTDRGHADRRHPCAGRERHRVGLGGLDGPRGRRPRLGERRLDALAVFRAAPLSEEACPGVPRREPAQARLAGTRRFRPPRRRGVPGVRLPAQCPRRTL